MAVFDTGGKIFFCYLCQKIIDSGRSARSDVDVKERDLSVSQNRCFGETYVQQYVSYFARAAGLFTEH
jgi:hypothetical protein